VGAYPLGKLLVTDRASRCRSFLAGSGVLRAVALLSIIGLLALLAAVMFGLGALLVALWRTQTPAVASGARPAEPAATLPLAARDLPEPCKRDQRQQHSNP
jgi:hypothetical protein